MAMQTINPYTGETTKTFDTWDSEQIENALAAVAERTPQWAATSISERCALMKKAAEVLRQQKDQLAAIITEEMGKLFKEAQGEVEKCAWVCDYYAEEGPAFLENERIESDAGSSYVAYQPLGTVLAVMPWNFPLWQVFRFAAPGLVAGNTAVLKHASNVPQSALAIEKVFVDAGFPANVFRTLMISASQVAAIIEDRRIHAVTLTGSGPAGSKVASTAAACFKKAVLELGGSDPFVLLEDADIELAVKQGVASRFLNSGQSCIAAKRFIVVDTIADQFISVFRDAVAELEPGDPMDMNTKFAPMARHDLRDELDQQVQDSIAQGAIAVIGCKPVEHKGAFYAASILDQVKPGMRAYSEELFGPVAIVIRATDEQDALRIANDSVFGLGGSVWTQDSKRGEAFALQLESGAAFVNGMVKSDPRLPFGGIKDSGFGRELSKLGIHEFVNAKTVWIR